MLKAYFFPLQWMKYSDMVGCTQIFYIWSVNSPWIIILLWCCFGMSKTCFIVEVGYRGLFLGHSFRSSWTPDKLVTWYLLIPFSKKKLKKVRKPGCPLRKMEESKMAAAVCQNWHFQPFWHIFEYFSLVKTCNFMFLMPRNPFLEDLLNFDFSFWRKG